MAPRVLIADDLSPAAIAIFRARGLETDVKIGLSKAELEAAIGDYDGIAIRSATKVTEKVIAAGSRLKVVGRAGIGVDNVDVKAASARGIIVMNTPSGNAITTAEHAITLMLALARQIPAADRSTQSGLWEKSKFLGVEVHAKTLGLIGCGNIGSIVADRAIGLKMRVIAYDPFLSGERAMELGVEKVELDALLARADFITLHTPMTDKTRNILSREAIAKCRPGVRIINCARGGLIDEAALADALKAGHVAGAALDVFAEEPAKANPLFGLPNVVCTPHLGASTAEAQENVALQVAEQIADFLLKGAVTNAVNFPSITAEEAPKLKPFIQLADQLGSLAGQMTESPLRKVRIEFAGEVAHMNIKALSSTLLAGLLRPMRADVNMVSAPIAAKEAGIVVEEVRCEAGGGAYHTFIRLTVVTERQERSVAGTVFSDGRPRLIQVKGVEMEAELYPHMLYITNKDRPGFIGNLGRVLGEAKVNIARLNLGRDKPGGDAIVMVAVDERPSQAVIKAIEGLPNVGRVHALAF